MKISLEIALQPVVFLLQKGNEFFLIVEFSWKKSYFALEASFFSPLRFYLSLLFDYYSI